MRHKTVTSKFVYYAGVFIGIAFCVFFAIFFNLINFEKPDGFALYVIFLVTSPISLYVLYINTSKNIYSSIDLENRTFIYGNIFFHQEVSVGDVKIIKKKLFTKSTFKIAIGNKTYFVMTPGADLKSYFESNS